ncbi:thiol-disulfide isomerase/thioredoxin [Algoriphagus iocasae]|uniref:Thiol-disulfide isomerase/thioredoxin n=1 Tax=Algoriphagus iocasae TaxID=1836499 RepID=A0A841N039_9BACT|nr:thioredoxin family protein [Algoriphagus iocasae]MBB6328268.1 thiol-disulfide isomerase/thioredoxin [Algoriphagus iocasae]
MKNYLCDKGAVFRQPQADISQKRSDFISQAEGLCISNFLNQKWFVKTFLILSILLSSINKVSSQVAYSPPGIKLVDNPGIPALAGFHRSGETRSDTFFAVALQDIDGGPGIEASFQSQSVRNEFQHQAAILDRNSKANESAVDCGQMTVDCFDASDFQGDLPQPENSFLFIEIPVSLAPDTLWFRYWTDFLKQDRSMTPGVQKPLLPSLGNFFEGNSGYKTYLINFPEQSEPITFSLRDKKNYLIHYWTFYPGDQIRIRADLEDGKMLFTGASADYYRAQYEISRLADELQFQAHPLMFTSDPGRMLSDSLTLALYNRSLDLPADLFPSMQFWIPTEPDEKLLDSLLTQDPLQLPFLQYLDRLNNNFTAEQKEQLTQRAWGEYLHQILPKLNLGKNLLSQPGFNKKFEKWIGNIPLSESNWIDPMYLSGINDLILLRTSVRGQSLLEGLADLSPALQDRILGLYVLSNFKQLENGREAMMDIADNTIHTPWIANLIHDLDSKNSEGSPFYSGHLQNLNAQSIALDQYRGKTLILNFWISGCKFCMKYYHSTLKPVFEHFKMREDIQFIAINADKDTSKWIENALSGSYSHPEMLQLHEDSGKGILEYYKISAFPQKILVDSDFRVAQATLTQYSPEELIQKIEQLAAPHTTQPELNTK